MGSNITRTHTRVVPFAEMATAMAAAVPPTTLEGDPCDG